MYAQQRVTTRPHTQAATPGFRPVPDWLRFRATTVGRSAEPAAGAPAVLVMGCEGNDAARQDLPIGDGACPPRRRVSRAYDASVLRLVRRHLDVIVGSPFTPSVAVHQYVVGHVLKTVARVVTIRISRWQAMRPPALSDGERQISEAPCNRRGPRAPDDAVAPVDSDSPCAIDHRVRAPGDVGGLAARLAAKLASRGPHPDERTPDRPVVATRSWTL